MRYNIGVEGEIVGVLSYSLYTSSCTPYIHPPPTPYIHTEALLI